MSAPLDTKLRRALRRTLRLAVGARPTEGMTGKARIGTFHKTGSMLWWNILKDLEAEHGLRVWHSSPRRPRYPEGQPEPRSGWLIEYNFHSQFRGTWDPSVAPPPTLVTIRDPRDVAISAMRYHLWSKERWLHNPDEDFPGYWRAHGATYQEAIRALPDDRARLVFELDHSAGRVIRRMLDAAASGPSVRLVRLETLMVDEALNEFEACFRHLGFTAPLLDHALDIARRNSVFSEGFKRTAHVQSGRKEQWRKVFDAELLAAFEERFGDALTRLGYAD